VEQATSKWGILRPVGHNSGGIPAPSLELGGVLSTQRYGDADVHELAIAEADHRTVPEQENEAFETFVYTIGGMKVFPGESDHAVYGCCDTHCRRSGRSQFPRIRFVSSDDQGADRL
jgi:hypothetical protein